MNLFNGRLPERHIMQMCNRCGGILQSYAPRKVTEDGQALHIFCWWKLEEKRKEVENANQVRTGRGLDDGIPPQGT